MTMRNAVFEEEAEAVEEVEEAVEDRMESDVDMDNQNSPQMNVDRGKIIEGVRE